MAKIITLAEYARMHNKSESWARRKAQNGDFKTAYLSGKTWLISEDDKWIDKRIKTK